MCGLVRHMSSSGCLELVRSQGGGGSKACQFRNFHRFRVFFFHPLFLEPCQLNESLRIRFAPKTEIGWPAGAWTASTGWLFVSMASYTGCCYTRVFPVSNLVSCNLARYMGLFRAVDVGWDVFYYYLPLQMIKLILLIYTRIESIWP